MRVAISGSHATGKSTLLAALGTLLPHYTLVEEPYYALLENGHVFADDLQVEDFESQLEFSLRSLTSVSGPDVIFERSPVDFLCYLAALCDSGHDMIACWFESVAAALTHLDLVVFVPVEHPDRIDVSRAENPRLRKRVNAIMRDVLLEDLWGLALNTIEVRGSTADRARHVMARVRPTASE